ncbi:MAG: hypothetical protein FWD79_08955 [Desulfobulbus sp.]|nr:hypothetical protein [Desulfobulbus sp.]
MKLKLVVGLAVLLMATQAHAASVSDMLEMLDKSDVTLAGNNADSFEASKNAKDFDDIKGMSSIGEDQNNNGGSSFTSTIGNMTFTFEITSIVSPDHDLSSGTWTLSWSGNTEDLLADFVVVIDGQGSAAEYRLT